MDTRSKSKINGSYRYKLDKEIKNRDTHFHIGISHDKNIQARANEIIDVMRANNTSMFSKVYDSTKEMIQEQLGDITSTSVVGKLMDKYVCEMKNTLKDSELQKLEQIEKLRNVDNSDVNMTDG